MDFEGQLSIGKWNTRWQQTYQPFSIGHVILSMHTISRTLERTAKSAQKSLNDLRPQICFRYGYKK